MAAAPPLRVSLVILSKRFGGAERHVVDLANRLAADGGLAVQLIVRRGGWLQGSAATGWRPAIAAAVQVDAVSSLFTGWGVRRALARFAPAVIHTHLGKGSRLVAGLGLGVPLVATLHGQYKAACYRRHAALICVAPWQRGTIPVQFRGTVRVIPNALDAPPCSAAARARVRRRHGIAEGELVVGGVGRMAPEKGFEVLLAAFRRAALPQARLLLVGDGPERAALQREAPPGTLFAGWQEEPADYYCAFDLFVSPARDEPFGLALLHAMQAGLPIVATGAEGPRWLLAEGAGVVVGIDDAAGMAAAIAALAADGERRRALAERAREKGAAFRPEAVVPLIIRCYRELAG